MILPVIRERQGIRCAAHGISLIEVLVGAAILALFFLPMFNALISTHKGTVVLQEDVQAVLLALELVDQAKLVPLRYVEGLGEMTVGDGAQPLLAAFTSSPLRAALASEPDELARVESTLQLFLSPLPEGHTRVLKIGERSGFCAPFSVTVEFPSRDQRGEVRRRSRTVTGMIIEAD